MIGYIDKKTPVSTYQPSREICDLTKNVQEEYTIGMEILNNSWPELNNYSVIDRDNKDKRTFNAFVDEDVEDSAVAWNWRGTRSEARKKGIAMHANLTSSYLRGKFQAQNDRDEVDREFSNYMDDIVEWMTLPTASNYQSSFLTVVFGMITSCVTYMGAEYCEIMQEVKEKTEKGYEKKEILDEVLSGFQAPIYASDEILITNAYERNIQKQKCIIERRYIDYKEAEARWSDHENWVYVNRGIKSIYSAENGVFYDVLDENNPNLIEECTYKSRRDDSEICFLNGIYFGDEDIEMNPIKHRDNRNAPKYNKIPFGYHRINEHFFYNKSLMNMLGWDNDLYDAMTEIVMNRALLEQNMPVAVSGVDKVDTEIVFPGAVTVFEDKDAKVTPILPNANFYAGFQALNNTKDSIADGSVSDVSSGQLPDKEQKAIAIREASQNAKKVLSGIGKNLGESTTQYMLLLSDIAIQHLTVAEVEELTGGKEKLKYRKFLLENKSVGGRNVSKKLIFSESLMSMSLTEEQKKEHNLELLSETGYPRNKEHIYLINPLLFSKMRYLSRVNIEEMFEPSDEFRQAVMTQVYNLFRNDPLFEAEALVRKVAYPFFKSDTDDLISKKPVTPMQPQEQPKGQMGGQVEKKMVSTALSGVM